MRTIACAQLGFASLFFLLTAHILPKQRALPMWSLSNLVAILTLVCDGLATKHNSDAFRILASGGMMITMLFIWWGLRRLYDMQMPWRIMGLIALGLFLAAIVAVVESEAPLRIIVPLLYFVTPGAILIAAGRDFVNQRRDVWTAQTWLLAGSAIGWALITAVTGITELASLTWPSLHKLVLVMNVLHDTGTLFIIMALNFCGFLLLSEKLSEELQVLASLDSLTGVFNRRAFRAAAQGFMGQPERSGHLLVLDLDHFKRINDRYGHAAGDEVLRGFSTVLGNTTRNSDLVGRTGGEEFCILLPSATEQEAMGVAERIRQQVADLESRWNGALVKATVSIGVAPIQDTRDLDHATAEADRALYAAKRSGRNRVIHVRSVPDIEAAVAAAKAAAKISAPTEVPSESPLGGSFAAPA